MYDKSIIVTKHQCKASTIMIEGPNYYVDGEPNLKLLMLLFYSPANNEVTFNLVLAYFAFAVK